MAGRQESVSGQFGAQIAGGPVGREDRISEEEHMKGRGLNLGKRTDLPKTLRKFFSRPWFLGF